ncbi:threonine synthase-like 2 [Hydractinia symbiolongicarpus]|uniref:threonine synthase-like 2 n=1 Tax=Hydractinia symbiolongicarpus TaxID=13093 RepID=UPI002550BE86|nr:threonine synthase-like 2 [Hydractinia symbiolongicarpus]XP_057301902.1 threonine synthase-like 2 [Hydractinia symbiolongicarpus]
MKYRSTRGYASGLSFEESLLTGYLPDGSLLMPETIPCLNKEKLQTWSHLSYKEICVNVFQIFAGEDFLSSKELNELIDTAYHNFPEDTVPLTKLYEDTYILELFHGPTHSFKDIPLAIIGPILNHVMKKRNSKCLVYVCTSGDTGSAVIEVTKDLPLVDTLVFYPGGDRITDLQRLLMTTVSSENIHVFSGDFFCDEFDKFFSSFAPPIKEKYPELVVTSLNSLVWVRIMAQMIHLIYAYFRVAKNFGNVNFFVPTGGMGHITSAVLVQKLGLPISISPCFNKKNLNSYSFLQGKEFVSDINVTKSLSVAMDIQIPCNIERLLYLWTNGDVDEVKKYMDDFKDGSCKATDDLLKVMQESVTPFIASDDDIISTIKRCKQDTNYIVEPHTAVGLTEHYQRNVARSGASVYMGCASPIKFSEVITSAGIGLPEKYNEYLNELKSRKKFDRELPSEVTGWSDFVMKYIEENIMTR